MIWTHIYDLILKLITLVLFILLLIEIPYFENHGFIMLIIAVILFFTTYIFLIRTFATYLYCKFSLKMNLNLAQAKKLNNAFTPALPTNLEWLPMKELKNIKDEDKYTIALEIYRNWEEENSKKIKQEYTDFKNLSKKNQIIVNIITILIIYLFVAGILNLPPANYITEIYCYVFETDKYSPMLNSVILIILPVLFLKKYMEKITK